MWQRLCKGSLLGLVVLMLVVTTARAEGFVTIYNDSTTSLEVDDIENAAEPFVAKDFRVYVWVNDKEYPSLKAFYADLDQFETEIMIYDPVTDVFEENAIVIELSTVTDRAWGQNIGFSKALEGTPLYAEGVATEIRRRMANNVRNLGASQAIVIALEEMYATAYPEVVATPTRLNEIVITPRATNVMPETPAYEYRNKNGGFFSSLWGVLLVIVIGALLVWFVVIPGFGYAYAMYVYWDHIRVIRRRVNRLLTSIESLLQRNAMNAESTNLYSLWSANGGKAHEKANTKVVTSLALALKTLGIALETNADLGELEMPLKLSDMQLRVAAWERLYFRVTGQDADILQLTEDQQRSFFDWLTFNKIETEQDQSLASEMEREWREIRRHETLAIEVMCADLTEIDQMGIMGYLDQVKQLIYDLREAKDNAEPKLEDARDAFAAFMDSAFPQGVPAEQDKFTYILSLFESAEDHIRNQRWLDAVNVIAQIHDAIGQSTQVFVPLQAGSVAIIGANPQQAPRIPDTEALMEPIYQTRESAVEHLLLGEFAEAMAEAELLDVMCPDMVDVVYQFEQALIDYDRRVAEFDEVGKGFRQTEEISSAIAEAVDDIAVVQKALLDGEYLKAAEFVRELTQDIARALDLMKALVELWMDNLSRLGELSKEVARVDGWANQSVWNNWLELQQYPESNWGDIRTHWEAANQVVLKLFDDPTDADDVASVIMRLNSMEEQKYSEAAMRLDEAFASLVEAERQLQAIVARLKLVEEIKADVGNRVRIVKAAIDKADTLERTQDDLIDQAVEEQIAQARELFSRAGTLAQAEDFTEFATVLKQAHDLAIAAYESAMQQVSELRELLENSNRLEGTALQAAADARAALANLIAAAHTSELERAVTRLQAEEAEAQAANLATANKEDHDLAGALRELIAGYESVISLAEAIVSGAATAESEYQALISQAKRAITEANKSIANARTYVNDSDASGSGSSALRRAQATLPSAPSYGDTIASIRESERNAQSAQLQATSAKEEAQRQIAAVEAAREAERQRRLAEQRRQQQLADAAAAAARAARRSAEISRSTVSMPSSNSSMRRASSMSTTLHRRTTSMETASRRRN